jgi:hypothetical protein
MREGIKLLLAVLAMAAAMPAAAQNLAPVAPTTPFARVQVDVLYNSNVAGTSAQLAAQRGIDRADVTYTPSLDLNYFKLLGEESVFLTGSAGYDFYQSNTILNRERLDGLGGVSAHVLDCDTTLQAGYGRHQTDLPQLTVATTSNTEEDITGTFSGTCNQAGKLVPSFSVSQTWSTNSALQLFTTNYRSLSTQGSILYRQQLIGDISLFGQYQQTEYPHRLFLLGSGIKQDGYDTYAGGLKLEHHFDTRLDLIVSVAETSVKSFSGISPDFNGITYNSSLAYQIGPRLTATLEASRQTTPANRLDASYSVGELYSLHADYKAGTALTIGVGASDNRQSYKGAALVPGVDIAKESVKSFFVRGGYNITPNLAVNLGAFQDQRHADVMGYSYTANRFSLSVSQAF